MGRDGCDQEKSKACGFFHVVIFLKAIPKVTRLLFNVLKLPERIKTYTLCSCACCRIKLSYYGKHFRKPDPNR